MLAVTLLTLQVAKDYMTRENHPDEHDPCVFCLCCMTGADERGGGASSSGLLKLPCFHAFHRQCFERWWLWQQGSWREQERELVQHTGATSVATLLAVRGR